MLLNEKKIGKVGMIHPKVAKYYKISDTIYYFQLSLTALAKHNSSPSQFTPFSKYPSIRRDIALLAPQSLPYAKIEAILTQFKPKLVTHFYLFDLFESDKIGSNNKSMAFAFIYHDLNKTLSDEKVNRAHNQFMTRIQEELSVTIRK